MTACFAEYVAQLRDTYGEEAVTVGDQGGASPCELSVVVTLVGTCEVTLAPSELLDSVVDSVAEDNTTDTEETALDGDGSAQVIREVVERYATSYSFLFRTDAEQGATSTGATTTASAHVSVECIEDVTLPDASVAALRSAVETTLATFDGDAVAVVFALESARQLASTLHEAEAVSALKAEARRLRTLPRDASSSSSSSAQQQKARDGGSWTTTGPQLGRRCVYFHHIFCTHKRASMAAWCDELKCFALCKVGYPGFLVLEGHEESCTEYVRRLQGLHWKHMEVRGEELVPVASEAALESARCIPPRVPGVALSLDGAPCPADQWPRYTETASAATMGLWCSTCHLAPLFRTGMRIYRAS